MNDENVNKLVDKIMKFSNSCIMDRYDLISCVESLNEKQFRKLENQLEIAIDTDNLEYLIEFFDGSEL